jgi:hypothetical protein
MQMFPKKRLEIVIEHPARKGLTALLEALKVTGYSVLPVVSGSGQHGPWEEAGQVTRAEGMAMVVCIVDPSQAAAVIEAVYAYVAPRKAVMAIADVQVVRGDRF